MHGPPDRAGLRRRTRDVQQQKHRQVTSPPQAVEIHRLVGHRPGHQFDVCFDGGIDVDVVALRLAVPAVQAHSEPCQRASQADRIVDRRARGSLCRRLDFEHRAPIRPVALAVDIPFRILHAADARSARGRSTSSLDRGRQRRHRVRASVRGIGAVRRGIRAGRPTTATAVFLVEDSIFFSHLPMKPPPPTGLVNRSGSSLSSISPSSSSANSCVRWLRGTCPGCLVIGLRAAARLPAASTLLARMIPNSGGGSSIADFPDAKLSDVGGRIAAVGDVGVGQRANTRGSTSALCEQCAMPLDRQIPPGQSGVAGQRGAQCRDRGCPPRSWTRARQWLRGWPARARRIDENGVAVRPRWVTGPL